jgi:hypothetical protein
LDRMIILSLGDRKVHRHVYIVSEELPPMPTTNP